MNNWIGVDFGSKLAGTTAVCFLQEGFLLFDQSQKKKNADEWLENKFATLKPEKVFIDAPLSLPGALTNNGNNYFYRECDVLTKAMSPMFLGGLTARAIKLKDTCNIYTFVETYPGYLVREILQLSDVYEKKKKVNLTFLKSVMANIPYKLKNKPQNWHQVDALLAWFSGFRYKQSVSLSLGNKTEGQIIV